MRKPSHIKPEKVFFFIVMMSSMTSQDYLKVALYIRVKERLAPGVKCKGNISPINWNIVIVLLVESVKTTSI